MPKSSRKPRKRSTKGRSSKIVRKRSSTPSKKKSHTWVDTLT